MKKMMILVAALGLTIATTSCKKDYVCKCTKTYTGTTSSTTSDDGQYTYKDTRPKADDRCNANEKTGSDLGGSYTRNCDIQ
ncbi:MAG: hypothetical protein H0U95_08845 [Bacteroidetes bacterium]|nr:hypothetical protein [Bacteroidota bacterium]